MTFSLGKRDTCSLKYNLLVFSCQQDQLLAFFLMQEFFIEQTQQITSYKLSYCARRKSGTT